MKMKTNPINIRYEQPEINTLCMEESGVLCGSWSYDGSLSDTPDNWNDLGTL